MLLAATTAHANPFNDTFDADTGVTASFTRNLAGVSFTYTFTADGDGGDTAWENQYGDGGSASINLASTGLNAATTERFTIARTDGADFSFASIFINNTAGQNITVSGYNDGVLVGASQSIGTGASGTLTFSGLGVDKVQVTSTDFVNTNIDSFVGDTLPPRPAIASASYDANMGALVVTGTNFASLPGASNDIVANKFTITGEGFSTYTLPDTANVEITSASSFTLILGAGDKDEINQILNKNGTDSTSGTTYNLAAAEDWAAGADPATVVADTTGNVITVSNVAVPTIANATYNASSAQLVVTGAGFLAMGGPTNDIVANEFTITGEGGSAHTLTDTSNVDITSATSFALSLSATDAAAINQILNKNGTSSSSGTSYNLAAADDWAAGADAPIMTADTTGNGITVSNVAVPTISGASYNASNEQMLVTGSGFLSLNGANNDIDASKFTLTGEGGSNYTLTDTSNADISSSTSFTLILSATDKAEINLIVNRNGTSSTSGTTYNLAAAEDWAAGADAAVSVADTTGNGVTVSNVAVPTIDSASYDASTGQMLVTGTGFFILGGASNDIDADKFTLTGDGGSLYTLTDTGNVDINSATSFTLVLSAVDKAGVDAIINLDGSSAADGTTYNLAAAEDWATGANPAIVVADTTGNEIVASNVNDAPVITSSAGSTNFVEGDNVASTPIAVDGDLIVSDPDSATLAFATAAITGGFHSAEDVLVFTNDGSSMGNIAANYNTSTGVLTLISAGASATLAEWQAALRALAYSNNSDTPNTTARSVSFMLNDGERDSTATSKVVNITATNDAPINTVPGAQQTNRDTTLIFSTANGNALNVGDVDADGGIERISLTASNALLSLNSTSGLTFVAGDGVSDANMIFEGTLVDLNAAMNDLSFAPPSGYDGPASLEITSDDIGQSGPGGAKTDTDTIAIDVIDTALSTLQLAVDDARGYARYGQMLDYVVTINNVGADATQGVRIEGNYSSGYFLSAAHWQCFGGGSNNVPSLAHCTPSSGSGALNATIDLPLGASLTFLVSVPVNSAATDDDVTFSVVASGGTDDAKLSASDTDRLVIYRDGFDVPYADGTQRPGTLMASATASTGCKTMAMTEHNTVLFALPRTAGKARIDDLASAQANDGSRIVVERLNIAAAPWLRLLTIDANGRERASVWASSTPGTELALGLADDGTRTWILLEGSNPALRVLFADQAGGYTFNRGDCQ